jgi:hypothetical protein
MDMNLNTFIQLKANLESFSAAFQRVRNVHRHRAYFKTDTVAVGYSARLISRGYKNVHMDPVPGGFIVSCTRRFWK